MFFLVERTPKRTGATPSDPVFKIILRSISVEPLLYHRDGTARWDRSGNTAGTSGTAEIFYEFLLGTNSVVIHSNLFSYDPSCLQCAFSINTAQTASDEFLF